MQAKQTTNEVGGFPDEKENPGDCSSRYFHRSFVCAEYVFWKPNKQNEGRKRNGSVF